MKNQIFKVDSSGKSKALFLKKNIALSSNNLNMLSKLSESKKSDYRICFHKNKKSQLHVMINCLVKKKKYFAHKHKTRDEFYSLIRGKLMILIISSNNKVIKKIILNVKKSFYFLKKNTIHFTIPLTSNCLFIEARNGPFKKSDTIHYPKLYRI